MAYKVFSNGDALTGGELNTYLMNQAVISFASTTARDAALPSPSEGQLVWLEDSNKYVYYTGSAWSDLITPASSGNAIINGAFDIWQRGTTGTAGYVADRWTLNHDVNPTTYSQSQQTFTPGAAPVAGYEGSYFYRYAVTTVGSGSGAYLNHKVEDVRSFAGQTVTFSFWGKADSARSTTIYAGQTFGSGGSSPVTTTIGTFNFTTSWQRFTATFAMPSITGKTIGTSSLVNIFYTFTPASGLAIDIWGVQLEAGSVATPFKRNAPSIQAELAACQRYYWRFGGIELYQRMGLGMGASTTSANIMLQYPVTMRASNSSIDYSTLALFDGVTVTASTTVTGLAGGNNSCLIGVNVTSGLTQFRPYQLTTNNSLSGYIGVSAEL